MRGQCPTSLWQRLLIPFKNVLVTCRKITETKVCSAIETTNTVVKHPVRNSLNSLHSMNRFLIHNLNRIHLLISLAPFLFCSIDLTSFKYFRYFSADLFPNPYYDCLLDFSIWMSHLMSTLISACHVTMWLHHSPRLPWVPNLGIIQTATYLQPVIVVCPSNF